MGASSPAESSHKERCFGLSHTCTLPVPVSSKHLPAKPYPSASQGLSSRLEFLNQINSGIGRKAVCREPIGTPPSPPFWPFGIRGEGLQKHILKVSSLLCPQGPLSPPSPPHGAQDHHRGWGTSSS